MPIALNPKQTYWLSLASDMDLTEENRPAFCFRFLNYEESLEYAEILDNFFGLGPKPTTDKEKEKLTDQQTAQLKREIEKFEERSEAATKKVIETAGRKLVDWRNMTGTDENPIAFEKSRLTSICNLVELLELLRRQMLRQVPDVEDKKKLDSPSPSDTGESVKSAQGDLNV